MVTRTRSPRIRSLVKYLPACLTVILAAASLVACQPATQQPTARRPATASPVATQPASATPRPAPSDTATAAPTATAPPSPTASPLPTADLGRLAATLQAALPASPTPDASGFTMGGFAGVKVVPLVSNRSEAPYWMAFSYGQRSYDPNVYHHLSIYTYAGGQWQVVDDIQLTCSDYLDPDAVTQVMVEPDHIWIQVSGFAGAHAGCYDLLSFDGRHLTPQVSTSGPSPGMGRVEDLNGDGVMEVVLDASDPYVFCYACGVRYVQYTVLRWTGEKMAPVDLSPLPDTSPPEVQQANRRAISLAQAGLWPQATTAIETAAALAPGDETVVWNKILINLTVTGWLDELKQNGYPLLVDVFYGDYDAALQVVRAQPVDKMFGVQSPLVSGTTAEGWEDVLSQRVISSTTQALAAEPLLAPAYFLRAWGTYLTTPDSSQMWDDLRRAAELAPDEPLYVDALAYLQSRAGAGSTGQPPAPGTEFVVDNSQPGFTTTGNWYLAAATTGYGGDCAWAARGTANTATWTAELPGPGSYEVFARWCADPNHDHSARARFTVSTAGGDYDVWVDQQLSPGEWVSLGRYFLPAGALSPVSLHAGFDGNVVADAVKVVAAGDSLSQAVPTPLPTPTMVVSNNPPSPVQQLTSGDLSRRLYLTGNTFYTYTPVTAQEEVLFDDCQAFPGPGCGGQRPGWRVKVRYLDQSGDLTVTYLVAQDYRTVLLETVEPLRQRQRIFLTGSLLDGRYFEVDRSPAGDWRLFALSSPDLGSEVPLSDPLLADLKRLVDTYNIVAVNVGEQQWKLYGLGPAARLSVEDELTLRGLAQELLALSK